MKKALLIAAAILFVASALNANAYIGIWNDIGHQVCSVAATTPYSTFSGYLMAYPPEIGMKSVECSVQIPTTVYKIGEVANPDINLTMIHANGLGYGGTWNFATCHNDWTYVYQWTFLIYNVPPGPVPVVDVITIGPHYGAVPVAANMATCLVTKIQPTLLTHLYINQPCEYAVEEASWGAIKSMF